MTWEQALLESIDKWEAICFGGDYSTECALCVRAMSNACKDCPLSLTGKECTTYDDLWSKTSDAKKKRGRGCNADIQLYLYFCMLYHEYYGDV